MILLKVYRKSSNLLFAEMIIALLFFIISFAVIIRVFAAADGIEREERRRGQAAILAQSAAEAYSVSGNAEQSVGMALGCEIAPAEGTRGKSGLALGEDFLPSEGGEITLSFSEERNDSDAGCYSELTLVFSYQGEEFYSLRCGAYIPTNGGWPVLD